MSLPRRILVPTDFSEHAELALDYALELASNSGGEVHVVHLYEIPTLPFAEGVGMVTADMVRSIEDAAKLAVERLVASKARAGVTLHGYAKYGEARVGIESAAAELGADLICMGTHGRRGVKRALLGSVAEFIVRTSKVPVLTLRKSHDAE